MESLCLVKSHEINRVTVGMYSTAERERERETEGLTEGGGPTSHEAWFQPLHYVFMTALGM